MREQSSVYMKTSNHGVSTADSDAWHRLASSCSWLSGVATLQDAIADMKPSDVLSAISWTTWCYMIGGLLVVGLFYYYVLVPSNYIRDMSEVGYDVVLEPGLTSQRRRGRSRRELAQNMRRLRKIGNLPPVFPNGWFVLLESDDLKPGQVKYVAALGENFAVFRTLKGVVHILDAYCPHLGANMAIGGVVKGDCLECPFHSWQFRGEDGKLMAVPYADKVPEFGRVKRWQSCETNTVIFVWYHAEGDEPSWTPEPIQPIMNKQWSYRGRNEYMINSHIQEIPENGGDVSHLNAIHGAAMFAGSDLRHVEKLLWSFVRHVWSATWAPSAEPSSKHTATMMLHHEIRLFNKIPVVGMNVRAEQIGPGYVVLHMETSLGPSCIVQCVTPIEPMLQRVVHRFFGPPLFALVSNLVIMGECIMFERDIMVWNHKRYEDKPLLVKEDKNITKHRRWFNQFYTENSPKFSFVKETIDW